LLRKRRKNVGVHFYLLRPVHVDSNMFSVFGKTRPHKKGAPQAREWHIQHSHIFCLIGAVYGAAQRKIFGRGRLACCISKSERITTRFTYFKAVSQIK